MDPENSVKCVCVGGGVLKTFFNTFFSNQSVSQRTIQTSLEKQLDPKGQIASQGWLEPVFLRKHIATCDFPPTQSAHRSTHVTSSCEIQVLLSRFSSVNNPVVVTFLG